jgi:hypothetical protein
MFKEYIKIKLLFGSVIEFEMTNGIVAISQGIINVPDRLKEFGRQLEEYPLQPDTVTINFKASMLYRGDIRLQGGLQYFDRFVIDVYPYKTNGEAAITVKVQNNKPELLGNNVEFPCSQTLYQ